MSVDTVVWEGDALRGAVVAIDQTRLPGELVHLRLNFVKEMWAAIKVLAIRGAPAIGIAGAFGVVLGAREGKPTAAAGVRDAALKAAATLATSRPTAVNLFWALDRMRAAARHLRGGADGAIEALLKEAKAILEEDRATGRAIAGVGAALLSDGDAVLTHCNAGGLATGGEGTALAMITGAAALGKRLHVYADETRPLWQGARLTAWEMVQAGIPVTVITDSMAAWTMKTRGIKAVVVGADRIAANGDTANKIGTYGVALSAKAHGIPFYVAAPSTTFDLGLPDGSAIPIEERDPREVSAPFGTPLTPEGAVVFNPAFDVTPYPLITALVTEKGVLRPPFTESIRKAFAREAR
jgi:methylthioribose-1-phosphate isomerase